MRKKRPSNKRPCVGCGGLRDIEYAEGNPCICCGSFGVVLPIEKQLENTQPKPTKRERNRASKKIIADLVNNEIKGTNEAHHSY